METIKTFLGYSSIISPLVILVSILVCNYFEAVEERRGIEYDEKFWGKFVFLTWVMMLIFGCGANVWFALTFY